MQKTQLVHLLSLSAEAKFGRAAEYRSRLNTMAAHQDVSDDLLLVYVRFTLTHQLSEFVKGVMDHFLC